MNVEVAEARWKERREQRRTDVGNTVVLIDPCDGRGPVTCCLWDISNGGACVLVPPDVSFPHCFKILVDGTWHTASVAWRHWAHIGLQFIGEKSQPENAS